jgi:hypothetical protein
LHVVDLGFHEKICSSHTFLLHFAYVFILLDPHLANVGPKSDASGKWRRLRDKEFNSLYISLNKIKVIICGILRWVRHVARMSKAGVLTKL